MKPDPEKKKVATRNITAQIRHDQYENLIRLSERSGMTVSAYIRALLGYAIEKDLHFATITQTLNTHNTYDDEN